MESLLSSSSLVSAGKSRPFLVSGFICCLGFVFVIQNHTKSLNFSEYKIRKKFRFL